MADISFADVKVHNEVEFCTITDLNVKKQLERLFLDERISYYEKWDDVSFFKRVRNLPAKIDSFVSSSIF